MFSARLGFWLLAGCTFLPAVAGDFVAPAERWDEKLVNKWYAAQPWRVGANYVTSNAVNQIEMWQGDTFDPPQIDRELGWAQNIGMNTVRVFLHDLVWQQDPKGYQQRIDAFLTIANRHRIKPIFVLFDSRWDPFPRIGQQREPRPGIYFSGWLQSPGAKSLQDPNDRQRLSAYVHWVIGTWAKDPRILAWDLWNEPDNLNQSSYGRQEPTDEDKLVADLLVMSFVWAREKRPTQPVTSAVWTGDWSSNEKLSPIARIQLDHSDIISFHDYGPAAEFEQRIEWLKRYNRPIFCTEYLARPAGSTFEAILPVAKKYKVAALNQGLVAGKTQANIPPDSWQRDYAGRPPEEWYQGVFDEDGKPYRQAELDFIREITSK